MTRAMRRREPPTLADILAGSSPGARNGQELSLGHLAEVEIQLAPGPERRAAKPLVSGRAALAPPAARVAARAQGRPRHKAQQRQAPIAGAGLDSRLALHKADRRRAKSEAEKLCARMRQ